jgi:hypothetical protein
MFAVVPIVMGDELMGPADLCVTPPYNEGYILEAMVWREDGDGIAGGRKRGGGRNRGRGRDEGEANGEKGGNDLTGL